MRVQENRGSGATASPLSLEEAPTGRANARRIAGNAPSPFRRPSGLARDPVEPESLLETGEALVIKMQPPQRMLEALKKMGIETP